MNDEMFEMIQLASQGFHCSQIILILGLKAQGKDNPDLIRAMNPLAGGLGFSGDICGALTGATCLIGLYAGKGGIDENEDNRLHPMVNELVEWFRGSYSQKYNGIHCCEILEDNPENQRVRCPEIVKDTYDKALDILTENGFDLAEGRA